MNKTILKDCLYNLSPDSGSNTEYNRGIVVGMITTLMATTGKDYKECVEILADCLPNTFLAESLPKAWKSDILNGWSKKL